jgi:ABC-type transport system involved in cytochrome bd biosynthesis fused ATPase/permease subunit
MYAGAAISIAIVITELALIPAIKAALRTADPSLTAAQVRSVNVLLTLEIVFGLRSTFGLVVVALWLWMARANGHGKNWARILSMVLVGLATLEAIRAGTYYRGGYLAHFTVGGHGYSVIHSVFGATVGVIVPVLWWLIGLMAVWLLWRPPSRAFFKPQRFA